MRRTVIAFLAAVLVLSPPARQAAAAPADHLAITTSVVNMRSGTMFSVQVVARDATGATDTGFSGTISLDAGATGGSNFPGGTLSVPISSGRTTVFGLVLNNAADGYTLTARAPGLADGVSNSFNVTAQRLAITSSVATMAAGTPFAVRVEARDGTGAVAENFMGNVTLVAGATGGSSFTGGDPMLAAAGGSVAFDGLTLDDAGNNYGIMASAAGVSAAFSDTFHVTASHLAVSPVTDTRAGDGFSVTVDARDANGNVAENYSGNVLLNAAAPGGSNFTGGTAVSPTVAGAATFDNLTLTNAADAYALSASAPGLNATSNGFDVTARGLAVTTPVAGMRAGTPFTVQVEARDADGVVAENFAGAVDLAAAAAGGSDFDGGMPSVNATGGVATFDALALDDAADGYSIGASSAGLVGATSNAFDVTASHLSAPVVASQRAGAAFEASVTARDANENIAENFTGVVGLNATATGGSNFAGGTAVAPALAGTATFTNLTLDNAADGYTVTAGSAGLVDVTSTSFDVTASHLAITTAVADMPAGTAFTVQVEARDAEDAVAENFDAEVALDAAAAGGANFNGGTQAAQASGGAAAFPDLVLETAADGYTITASAAGLSSGVSNSFNVIAGRPDVSIDDVSVTEGNSGNGTATFTVSLSQPATGIVSVAYTIGGVSASSGTDFVDASGTLTFAPGVTAQAIAVTVKGDLLNEADETFVVDLANAVNASIVDGQGVGTIRNDDPLPIIVVLPVLAVEGSMRPNTAAVTVRLSTASGQPVSVSFKTAEGTAVDGVGEANPDYTARAGTLVFAPGQREQMITISLRNDLVVEADEIFFVALAAPVNATLATPRTVVVIVDDDAPARQLAALAAQVLDLDLDLFRKATLVADLRLNCGGMHQFVRDVGRYRGAHISAADADALTAAAQRLAVSIRCPI